MWAWTQVLRRGETRRERQPRGSRRKRRVGEGWLLVCAHGTQQPSLSPSPNLQLRFCFMDALRENLHSQPVKLGTTIRYLQAPTTLSYLPLGIFPLQSTIRSEGSMGSPRREKFSRWWAGRTPQGTSPRHGERSPENHRRLSFRQVSFMSYRCGLLAAVSSRLRAWRDRDCDLGIARCAMVYACVWCGGS